MFNDNTFYSVLIPLLVLTFIYLILRQRSAKASMKNYENELLQWEGEGYDVSELKRKWFPQMESAAAVPVTPVSVTGPPSILTRCPDCHAQLKPGAIFCTQCGKRVINPGTAETGLQGNRITCSKCGYTSKPGRNFCIRCGSPLINATGMQNEPRADTVTCPQCGYANTVSVSFCTRCGHALRE